MKVGVLASNLGGVISMVEIFQLTDLQKGSKYMNRTWSQRI